MKRTFTNYSVLLMAFVWGAVQGLDNAGPEPASPAPAGAGFPVLASPMFPVDYGPVDSSDSLWSIANRLRPDSSVTVQQMMLALLRTNPDGFINNNINWLKKGHILQVPADDELRVLSAQEALAEIEAQNRLWWEATGRIAAYTPKQPDSIAAGMEAGETVMAETEAGETVMAGMEADEIVMAGMEADEIVMAGTETDEAVMPGRDAELQLVGLTENDVDSSAGQEAGPDDSAASESLALVNERLEMLSQENTELKDRLSEAENIINELNRLAELKDNELVILQSQSAAESPKPVPGDEPVEPEAERPEPGALFAQVKSKVAQVIAEPGDNLMVIVGAIGGIMVLIIAGLLFARRKRAGGTGKQEAAAGTDSADSSLEAGAEGVEESPELIDLEDNEDESQVEPSTMDFEAGEEEDEDTVFVPKSSEPEEDLVANKLDLAKAYIELGDEDNVKSILAEVLSEGNAEQREEAQQLLKQI